MKLVLDNIDTLAEPLKAEYELKDGKYVLRTEGDNPLVVALNTKISDAAAKIAASDAKVNEFRTNNVSLMKELDLLRPQLERFKDIDPEAARDALTKVAALGKKGIKDVDDVDTKVKSIVAEMQKPFNEAMLLMKQQVEATTAKAEADRLRADSYLLQSQIADRFNKVGGKAKAAEFIVGLARDVFEVKDGTIVAKAGKFNPEKPGESLTVEDWMVQTVKEHDYVIEPSRGGGAPPSRATGSSPNTKPGQTVLKNPTPQELGQYSKDIKAGKVRVEHDAVN